MGAHLFIDNIIEKGITNLAVIGIAKNAGKTVTFNTIVGEAKARGLRLALLSYGRDGEDIDAITGQEKPKIYIPREAVFVTAAGALASATVKADRISSTGINTLLGEVNVYRCQRAGNVELVGVNSATRMREVMALLPDNIDLKIIDGALDRRSSALPALSDGFILATGAVVGNREELVVERTLLELRKLMLPQIENRNVARTAARLFAESKGGIIVQTGEVIPLNNHLLFNGIEEIETKLPPGYSVLVADGALVNSIVDKLMMRLNLHDCYLLVRDGTRVFLDHRHLSLLDDNNIKLRVLDPIQPLGITVNPYNPTGPSLVAEVMVKKLRSEFPELPVYDILSREYLDLSPYVYN